MDESKLDGAYNVALYKEFKRITNSVSLEEFIEIMPQGKFHRVSWPVLYESLKQNIFQELTSGWNSMWEEEKLANKMAGLEAQKEKFQGKTETAWRPKLGDPNQQLIAKDLKILENEKKMLQIQAEGLEKKLESLKSKVIRKRQFLQAFQTELQKYKSNKEELDRKVNEKIENHLPDFI